MKQLLLEKKQQFGIEKDNFQRKSNIFSKIRMFLFLLFIGLVLLYSNYSIFFIIALLWIVALAFLLVALYHGYINREVKRLETCISIIEQYEKRRTNEWRSEQTVILSTDDSFLEDLDIVGKNSLFQFLNFTYSLGGRNRLLETLSLKRVNKQEIIENQESIEELKNNPEFVLFFQEKLTHVKNISKIDFKEYFYLLDGNQKGKKLETVISIFFSIFTIMSLLLALLQVISIAYFIGIFLFQLASSYFYAMIYKEDFDKISKCSRYFSNLKGAYEYVESQRFTALKNKRLQREVKEGKEILLKLEQIVSLNSYRFNFITSILFNAFFSLNFLILYKYTELVKKDHQSFKNSIIALEELEVLISLSTIAFVKDNVSFPTIKSDISLEVKNVKHPLLEEEKCISNDFQCRQDIQIITGSNMSGKTSFMRTIGINLVLAYTGTYVNADVFHCSIMKIFTSINVKDDISNGISTFYGELKRIKEVLDYSENNKPMVIFIDEIFKGTNYNDRILGAKEVLKKLADLPCIVFLTTHDFELCEINHKKIHNYHFEETYKQNKISFDYKMKKGKCKTTNAKYLMKEIGIID